MKEGCIVSKNDDKMSKFLFLFHYTYYDDSGMTIFQLLAQQQTLYRQDQTVYWLFHVFYVCKYCEKKSKKERVGDYAFIFF